jgi:hypothetical protein
MKTAAAIMPETYLDESILLAQLMVVRDLPNTERIHPLGDLMGSIRMMKAQSLCASERRRHIERSYYHRC